jgi:hypothetical protein
MWKPTTRQGESLRSEDWLLVGPVHLSLVAGRGLKALLRQPGRELCSPNLFDVAAHDRVATIETVVSEEVLVDALCGKAWLSLEPTLDDALEGVELRGSPLAVVDGLGALGQIAFDRAPVATDHPADLGVGVTLSVQGPYVHPYLLIDQVLDLPGSSFHRRS